MAYAKQEAKPGCAGYFLRSSVAPDTRMQAEAPSKPVFLPVFGEKPAKLTEQASSEEPKKTAVTEQALKRPNKMLAQSVVISGLMSPQFGLAPQIAQDAAHAAANKMSLPPLSAKVFREADPLVQSVELDVTSLKSAPPAVKTFKQSKAPAQSHTFLMIKEIEFPHLFENPIVKHQNMTKFFDEQDFNSDCETVERNRVDLLKQLE